MPFDPRGLEFSHWSHLTGQLLARYGYAAKHIDEKHWQDWANSVLAIPAISALHVPSSQHFKTWQDWGARLYEALFLLGL